MALAINPIAFYFGWPSAEACIFAFVGMSMAFWAERSHAPAALFAALAATLNVVLLVLLAAICLHWAYERVFSSEPRRLSRRSRRELAVLACAILIACLPLAYNYANAGAVNLTAAHASFLSGNGNSVLERFWAYLVDLNFGLLPYYTLLLVGAVAGIPLAIWRRNAVYLLWMFVFLALVAAYSFMSHINCGMSGIARYNAWSAVVMLFALFCELELPPMRQRLSRGVEAAAACLCAVSIAWSGSLVLEYGPFMSSKANYVSMTPVAARVLEQAPGLYNPLHSTFNSRTVHVDGGYSIQTPVVYADKDGNVRKLLVQESDRETLRKTLAGADEGSQAWLDAQVDAIAPEGRSYISVPRPIEVRQVPADADARPAG